MGPLVGAGALIVPDVKVRELEAAISGCCDRQGFPPGDEFKWSPSRGTWMHTSLQDSDRLFFFLQIAALLNEAGCRAVAVIADRDHNPAISGRTPEQDTVAMLIERVANRLRADRDIGLVIADRPGGGRQAEETFLGECLEVLQQGTDYVAPQEICLNVVSTSSHLVRLLQAADLVTSCVTAYVGGEDRYSPPVFTALRQLFPQDYGRSGGLALKIHPDFRYANLYHWLLGDSHFVRSSQGFPMPLRDRPYAGGARLP